MDVMQLRRMVMAQMASGAKIIKGSFTLSASDKGSAVSISIPYSGRGYPIIALIYPKGGYQNNTEAKQSPQYRGVLAFSVIKDKMDAETDYSGSGVANQATVSMVYKSNASNPEITSGNGYTTTNTYSPGGATSGSTVCMKFISEKQMSIFVSDTSYGFIAGVEYEYMIIYSE